MAKKKFPTEQTRCIDDCECVECGYKFDGQRATNNDMDCNTVNCPKCKTEMYVSVSVEYMCTQIDD